MEKESIVIRINKHSLYRGIRIALSLVVFLYFSYSLWNKYEYGFSDDTVYLLFVAGSGAALALAVLLGFCFDCFDNNNDNWDRKKLVRGQGYLLAVAVIIQILMNLILYSMGNVLWAWEKYGAVFFTVYRVVMLAGFIGLVFLAFKMGNQKGRFYLYLVQGIGVFYSMLVFYMFTGNMDEYEPYHFIVVPYFACFVFSNLIYCVIKRITQLKSVGNGGRKF